MNHYKKLEGVNHAWIIFLVGDYPSLAKVIDESMKTNDGMPDFVLNRIYEIMKKNNITDISKVGLYGLTYKENVDDMRESPTLQMLESMERHLLAVKEHLQYGTSIIDDDGCNHLAKVATNADMLFIQLNKENENKSN